MKWVLHRVLYHHLFRRVLLCLLPEVCFLLAFLPCKLMFLTNILHFSSKILFPATVITYHEVLLNIIYEHQILVTLVIVQPVTFFLTLSNSFFTVCYLFQLPLIYIICCSTYQIVLHPSISSSIYYATVQYQCSRIRGHPNL